MITCQTEQALLSGEDRETAASRLDIVSLSFWINSQLVQLLNTSTAGKTMTCLTRVWPSGAENGQGLPYKGEWEFGVDSDLYSRFCKEESQTTMMSDCGQHRKREKLHGAVGGCLEAGYR